MSEASDICILDELILNKYNCIVILGRSYRPLVLER